MRVELFGLPRERAGVSEVTIEAATLGELLRQLVGRFPGFAELVDGDALRSSYIANLNGDCFVRDPQTQLAAHDCVLILSADAGG